MATGDAIEIYKEVGNPNDVARRFDLAHMKGTHAIGHTRMATESAVTTLGAHPFSTGADECLVHNGSLSNHNNLRRELIRDGMKFDTENDTECSWPAIVWAFAHCSTRWPDGALVFGSEIKAILAHPGITASPDPVALDQIFTFWSTLSPRTFFRGIAELPPGHYMLVRDGRITLKPTGRWPFPRTAPRPCDPGASTRRNCGIFSSTPPGSASGRMSPWVPT